MTREQIEAELRKWRTNRILRGFSGQKKLRLMRLLHMVEIECELAKAYVERLNKFH